MLLAGQSFEQIARQLGLVKGTVLWHAQQIYKQHGVRTLPQLLTKHNKPIPGQIHLTPEIRRRLLAGDSVGEIATALNVPRMMIYNQRQQMRKKGHKLPDARKLDRVGRDFANSANEGVV
jgi:DNA-binding CsgD family transcriptional regulator